MESATASGSIDPAGFVGAGKADAIMVLVASYQRRISWSVICVGVVVVTLFAPDSASEFDLDSVGDVYHALFSWFALIIVGIGVRLVGSGVGLAAAYHRSRRTGWIRMHQPDSLPSRIRIRVEEVRVARAYADLRLTTAVRRAAADRAGLGQRADRRIRAGIAVWDTVVICAGLLLGWLA